MTTAANSRRREKPPAKPDPRWLAYLRLRGIAEHGARVAGCAKLMFLRPDCAVALFQMRGGWWSVAAFKGEAYWHERCLDEASARGIFGELAARMTSLLAAEPQ